MQEKLVDRQRKDISSALGRMKALNEGTRNHLETDLACLFCLQPLLEPQVLVPCGHSICVTCSAALDAKAAENPEYGAAKFCPLCAQGEGSRPGSARAGRDDDAVLSPVEAFPNPMLDMVLSRLRTKVQDVQGEINAVLAIFEMGDMPRPLPGAAALKGR